jgi:hypothetical protein
MICDSCQLVHQQWLRITRHLQQTHAPTRKLQHKEKKGEGPRTSRICFAQFPNQASSRPELFCSAAANSKAAMTSSRLAIISSSLWFACHCNASNMPVTQNNMR